MRQDALPHVLLTGPPGLGKTTLAGIVAAELGTSLKTSNAPSLETSEDITRHLITLEPGDVFFIDEIHRLQRTLEEFLYPIMEDFEGDIVFNGQPAHVRFPQFTLIGATTRSGLVSKPMLTRFPIVEHLDFYTKDELTAVVARSALILGIGLDLDSAAEIAQRSRGTARIANNILGWVRDYALSFGLATIDAKTTRKAMSMLDIDERGLTLLDRRLLRMVVDKFDGGPVGVGSLAVALGEEPDTLQESVEPYLIRQGLLARTPRGRRATRSTYAILGIEYKQEQTKGQK